jgi:hypothetical protein
VWRVMKSGGRIALGFTPLFRTGKGRPARATSGRLF